MRIPDVLGSPLTTIDIVSRRKTKLRKEIEERRTGGRKEERKKKREEETMKGRQEDRKDGR